MESWLEGILKKRSLDSMRILCDLLEAGLKKGECSANDIREIKLEQVNCIGACFKILNHFGFVHTDRRIKTTAEKKHGRRVDVWELQDQTKAEQAIMNMQCILTDATIHSQAKLPF